MSHHRSSSHTTRAIGHHAHLPVPVFEAVHLSLFLFAGFILLAKTMFAEATGVCDRRFYSHWCVVEDMSDFFASQT